MSKPVLYKYNPETDNFERIYPKFGQRLLSVAKTLGLALLLSVLMVTLFFHFFDSPTEKTLRRENNKLKNQYGILSRRLDNSLKILARLQERDENFYRVIMQMEPMTSNQRLSGLDNTDRYKELRELSDAALVSRLAQSMELLERQLYAQLQSFDQLKRSMENEEEKLSRIPSVIPLKHYTIAAGYGLRKDPLTGISRYHEGMDFAAPAGTPVYATGEGTVVFSERTPGYGNCIDIDHGYNYQSRYANLSEILVNNGDVVQRGQLIGRVGSSGKSTASHLHYEVRYKEESQNPVNYYFSDLSPEEYTAMLQTSENAGHLLD